MAKEFVNRVRSVCKERGIPIRRLEMEAGLANGYFRSSEKSNTNPKVETMNRIADYLGVSPAFLRGETEPDKDKDNIPLLSRVTAGSILTFADNCIGQLERPHYLDANDKYIALRVDGDAMSPRLIDGDIVIVKLQDSALDGDIVLVTVGNDEGICRVFRATDSAVMFIASNATYDPLVYTCGEIYTVPVRILGKIVELRRSF